MCATLARKRLFETLPSIPSHQALRTRSKGTTHETRELYTDRCVNHNAASYKWFHECILVFLASYLIKLIACSRLIASFQLGCFYIYTFYCVCSAGLAVLLELRGSPAWFFRFSRGGRPCFVTIPAVKPVKIENDVFPFFPDGVVLILPPHAR